MSEEDPWVRRRRRVAALLFLAAGKLFGPVVGFLLVHWATIRAAASSRLARTANWTRRRVQNVVQFLRQYRLALAASFLGAASLALLVAQVERQLNEPPRPPPIIGPSPTGSAGSTPPAPGQSASPPPSSAAPGASATSRPSPTPRTPGRPSGRPATPGPTATPRSSRSPRPTSTAGPSPTPTPAPSTSPTPTTTATPRPTPTPAMSPPPTPTATPGPSPSAATPAPSPRPHDCRHAPRCHKPAAEAAVIEYGYFGGAIGAMLIVVAFIGAALLWEDRRGGH